MSNGWVCGLGVAAGVSMGVLVGGTAFGQASPVTNAFLTPLAGPPTGGATERVWDLQVTPDGSRMFVSTSGSYEPECVDPSVGDGAVFIYDFDPEGRVWELNDRLARCTALRFGQKLGISDDGAAFVAGHLNQGAIDEARVWFFREINGEWVEELEIFSEDSLLGMGVDMDSSGDRVIASDTRPADSFIRIYERGQGGGWSQTFALNDGNNDVQYGAPVAIDGEWAAYSFFFDGVPQDLLAILRFNGQSWVQTQTFEVDDLTTNLDTEIEINGDRMIVGSAFAGGRGVQIFELDTDSGLWSRVFQENESFENRPFDVDIEGDRAVAALNFVDSVRVYEKIDGDWQVTETFAPPSLGGGSKTARAVTLVGDRAFVGGEQKGVVDGTRGRGWVTEYEPPTFVDGFNETFETDGPVPPSVWFVPRENRTAEVINGELRIAGDFPGANNTLSALGDFIEGDFDATIDWTAETIAPLSVSFQFLVVAELVVIGLDETTGGDASTFRISRVRELAQQCVPSDDVYKSWDSILGGGGCVSSLEATTAEAGSFRITREGSVYTSFYRDANNPDWVQLRQSTVSDVPVRFAFGSEGTQFYPTSTVRYDNFIVTTPSDCPPDINDDGVLTGADFNAWLNAFSAMDPAADQNNDGVFTGADFNAFLTNFSAGCL